MPAMNTHRFVRMVAVLKLALPLAAVALLLVVWLWPSPAPTPRSLPAVEDAGAVTGLRYVGTDERDRPYEIRATEVVRETDAGERYAMSAPSARLDLDEGWIALEATGGSYVPGDHRLDLFDGLVITDARGWTLTTDGATVDLKGGTAEGVGSVQGEGPRGSLEADGFRIESNGDRIVLLGRSRLVIQPDGQGSP